MRDTPHDRILKTATRLFLEGGVQATGVHRIAADADVAPMTVYRHFVNKDLLVAAVLEQWSSRSLEFLANHEHSHCHDPTARIAELLDTLEEFCSWRFRGSLDVIVVNELRGKPEHPAHAVAMRHRVALRQYLLQWARSAGARAPGRLAAQLHLIIDGALASAPAGRPAIDRACIRRLAQAALDAELGVAGAHSG